MVKEAEANAADDAKRKQEIEVRNQTDSLVYSTERTLAEHGSKLAEADRKAIDDALAEAKEALKGEDLERMKQAQEALTRASHKLAEIMYREAQAGPGRGRRATAPGPRARRVRRRARSSTPSSRTWARRSRRVRCGATTTRFSASRRPRRRARSGRRISASRGSTRRT